MLPCLHGPQRPLIPCLVWLREPLEREGLVAWLAPKEPTVTPAALESLAFLEPG